MTEICPLIPLVPLAQGLQTPDPPSHAIWTAYWHFPSNGLIGWAFKPFLTSFVFPDEQKGSKTFAVPVW